MSFLLSICVTFCIPDFLLPLTPSGEYAPFILNTKLVFFWGDAWIPKIFGCIILKTKRNTLKTWERKKCGFAITYPNSDFRVMMDRFYRGDHANTVYQNLDAHMKKSWPHSVEFSENSECTTTSMYMKPRHMATIHRKQEKKKSPKSSEIAWK